MKFEELDKKMRACWNYKRLLGTSRHIYDCRM